VEFVKILPALLWVGLAFLALYLFYGPAAKLIESHEVAEVGVGIVNIKLVEHDIAKLDPRLVGGLPPGEAFRPVNDRFMRIAKKIVGATILWVDDKHPTQNLVERRTMSAYGLRIDMARSTNEALQLLDLAKYDVIISNMRRDNDEQGKCYEDGSNTSAGCDLLKKIALRPDHPPGIIYAGSYNPERGTPAYALGMTNRTDYLVQFVFDALERRTEP
jgi:hypothetical protein